MKNNNKYVSLPEGQEDHLHNENDPFKNKDIK